MRTKFQDSNFLVKLWRLRWYVAIPFEYARIKWINRSVLPGISLWKVLVGDAQIKMNWVYELDREKLDELLGEFGRQINEDKENDQRS